MSNYYRRYPGDFLRDTMHLSLEECGAYDRLMDIYYSTGQPIPNDLDIIKRYFRESKQKTRKIMKVLAGFFEEKDGLLYHKKIEFELAKSLKMHKTAVANGRAGGKASAIAKAQANRVATSTSTNSITSNTIKEGGEKIENPILEKIPDLDLKAWEMYLAYRRKAKLKKLTDRGAELAAKKLVKLAETSSCTQIEIVDQTETNGWTGLFELKSNNNGQNRRSCASIFDDGVESAFRDDEPDRVDYAETEQPTGIANIRSHEN